MFLIRIGTMENDEPQGIVDVDESMFRGGESLNLALKNAHRPVWLLRLPPDMTKIWQNQSLYQGQTIGQLTVPTTGTNNKISLKLAPMVAAKCQLDNQYEVKMTKSEVSNQYVFTEADYSQFKEDQQQQGQGQAGSSTGNANSIGTSNNGTPTAEEIEERRQRSTFLTQVTAMPQQPKLKSLNKDTIYHEAKWTRKVKETEDPNAQINLSGMGTTDLERQNRRGRWSKRGFIPYARTIPKRTEIVGQIVHECQVVPMRLAANDKLRLLTQKRHLKSLVKKSQIRVIDNKEVGRMHGKATPNIQTGATMALSRTEQQKKQTQKEEGRNARLDKKDLMRRLFECFRQYEYWSIKNLRAKLKQPELWLRENLEEVAVLEKGGTFSQKWRLKPEYRATIQAQHSGFADEEDDRDEKDEKESDESDIDMEDIAAV